MSLTLEQARTILEATQAKRVEHGFLPLAIAVLDAGGQLITYDREEGCSVGRYEIAFGKAYGAVAMGVGSRTLAGKGTNFIVGATAAMGGRLVAAAGGVLVKDAEGTILGAVGVSGEPVSDNDEVAAVAGITDAGFVADAG